MSILTWPESVIFAGIILGPLAFLAVVMKEVWK